MREKAKHKHVPAGLLESCFKAYFRKNCLFQDGGGNDEKINNEICAKALWKKDKNYTINKKVEKQSDIVREIDCTTSSNDQRAQMPQGQLLVQQEHNLLKDLVKL